MPGRAALAVRCDNGIKNSPPLPLMVCDAFLIHQVVGVTQE